MRGDKDMIKVNDVKEDFCTSCIGAGLAIAGAGATTAAGLTKTKHYVWKQVLLWSGVAICVIAIILLFVGAFVK